MLDFLNKLKVSYSTVLQGTGLDQQQVLEMQTRLNALRLTESVLRKVEINRSDPAHALQIGILGPTQAGKSTLVNMLLHSTSAGVSPLAGYTVHAQGFVSGTAIGSLECARRIFPDFEQLDTATLDPGNYKQYALEEAAVGQQTVSKENLAGTVVWDSPDFDSIESRGYRTAVLRVAALADVIILMLSKDKYADRSVWDMIELLRPLEKPMLVCINKLNPDDETAVIDSFWQRYADNAGNSQPENAKPLLISLPYSRGLDDTASQFDESISNRLIESLQQVIGRVDRPSQSSGAESLIGHHWDSWLEPVRTEHEAAEQWQETVKREIQAGLVEYQQIYLEHPQKYDTFNKAIAELLTLLEIPGIATPLVATRKLVTWPVRKLLGVGQSLIGDSSDLQAKDIDQEQQSLVHVCNHVLSKLSNSTLDLSENEPGRKQWWLALNKQLRQQQSQLESGFSSRVETYQSDFSPEIDKAAEALYENLKEQPVVLNGLRAARVTTDAAAVILAVKSGGLAASDLLLAPAMLSVTSILTEGAIGKYMDKVRDDFKQVQLQTVDNEVMTGFLETQLTALSSQLQDTALFSISPEELEQAETLRNTLGTPALAGTPPTGGTSE